jgi:hypothetical protein
MTQALAASAALASTAQAAEPCVAKSKVITRDKFDQYVALYNAADPGFTQFYNDDVVMETVPPLTSAAEIRRFRSELSSYVVETVHVEYYVADENGSAAQFLGEFRCIRDMPLTAMSGLFGKAVKKGQILKQRGSILYGVVNGKFKWIRAFPPIILHDWS